MLRPGVRGLVVGSVRVPAAEIHWLSIEGSPYAGQVWTVEVEHTPKPIARTIAIMTGLLSLLQ